MILYNAISSPNQVVGILVIYSRISEIEFEIEHGESKLMRPFIDDPEMMARMRGYMEGGSGYHTPVFPGHRQPLVS